MSYKFAGQNKAVARELVTNQSAYQQQVAIYDALVDLVRRDPRMLTDSKSRESISRAQNLLRSESTSLFKPHLNELQQYVAANPNPKDMEYGALLSILKKPLNTFGQQKKDISGWYGAEAHHMVPSAQMASMQAGQGYRQWGDTLYGAGKVIPITSSAYNGLELRSEPGHNLSHYDIFGRQFNKGDAPDPGGIIDARTPTAEAVHMLTDSAKASHLISRIGGQADAEVFLPQLTAAVSDRIGRQVNPGEFSSTLYSPLGQGRTEAANIKKYTDKELVEKVTEEAYGGSYSDGAEEYLEQRGASGLIKTTDERRLENNARKRNKNRAVLSRGAPLLRPDLGQTLAAAGIDADKLLSVLLR